MKKFLSLFVALAMVLSLFAGVGARSAKAATTLTVTPSGNFAGGVAGSGATAVNAVGNITTISGATDAIVDVTTAGVGVFDVSPNVSVMKPQTVTATSIDADWATLGNQLITFSNLTGFSVGDEVTVAAGTTSGVGAISDLINATLANVHVTTAAVGTLTGALTVKRPTTLSPAVNSTDEDWKLAALATQTITFNSTTGLVAGDRVTVSMIQQYPGVAATASLTLGGTITTGNVATVTWQDTTGASHTASYTVLLADDTLEKVTTKLVTAINAVVGGNVTAKTIAATVIMLTQDVAGTAGNGKTLTAGAAVNTLIIHTLGGLTQPAYVELGKTIQLCAVDQTGAVVTPAWSLSSGTSVASVGAGGLVTASAATTGPSVVTAALGSATASFAVVVIPVQTITSLTVTLVPAGLKVSGKQQFGAIAANAAYSALDYTTQAAWTDDLPVASVSNVAPAQGLLTYSTAETGHIYASAGGFTATATVTIDAAGVVTLKTVPVAVKRVIVLTIGTDIVTVDGKATSVDAAPEIIADRTFVPIRFIAETFGSTVVWIPETKSITITLGTTTIGLQIGNKTAVINTKIIALEAAPYIKNSRTMVPLRVISESFGGDVAWDPALRTITITYILP